MKKTVLVVDDSLADRNHLESLLVTAGYHVVTASDGSLVVGMAKANHVQLILMDINMPVIDGFAATRTLREDAATKDIPVVFITVKDQKADKAWGYMLGAKGYITKPYTSEEVLRTLEALL